MKEFSDEQYYQLTSNVDVYLHRIASVVNLNGFHLKLICAAHDLSYSDIVFQAEVRALLQPLSLNDSGSCEWEVSRHLQQQRRSLMIFVPISLAANASLWSGVVGWLKGHPGRMLRMRVNDIRGDAQTIDEIVPVLQRILKELTEMAHRTEFTS